MTTSEIQVGDVVTFTKYLRGDYRTRTFLVNEILIVLTRATVASAASRSVRMASPYSFKRGRHAGEPSTFGFRSDRIVEVKR